MSDNDLTGLKALADSLTRQTVDTGERRPSLDEIVGESYVKELASMTEAEAIEHLRSAHGEKLLHAYLVLSARPNYALRANHPVLTEVCLRFMTSSRVTDRMMGAGDLGIWLEGSNDKNASQALALMIDNREEPEAVRAEAYSSLELINNKRTALERALRNWEAKNSPGCILNEIDWNFVSSFL